MKFRLSVALLLSAASAFAQRPSDEELKSLLETARGAALNYNSSLPNFICTQMVHRNEDPRGNNRWREIDVLTVRLSYSGGVEDYKLSAINGKSTNVDFMSVGGPTTKGEFGTLLVLLFHPDSRAEFKWKGWGRYKKYRVGTFTYRVDKEHSGYAVSYGASTKGPEMIHPAYHGEFQFDPGSGLILHVSQEAELPLNYPIRQSSVAVDYDYTEVGGRRYLLPAHAEILMSSSGYRGRNLVDFKDYRKFETETSISFDK